MQNIFCFHIEPTRGCTRRCEFCGINAIKEQVMTPKFMEIDLLEKIVREIHEDFKPKLRIDFSLHGEPLLHPKINEIISISRKHLPFAQLSLITNGDMIANNKVKVDDLFDSGLNYLMVDEYERSKEAFTRLYDNIYDSKINVIENTSIWSYNSYK